MLPVSTPATWQDAHRPDYDVNEDLEYPYSECPYLGEYHLVQIPETGLVEHIDYWGEGLIEDDDGITGFKDSYNINHVYQYVINKGENYKIPNRIPVLDYDHCDTEKYISDDSVKIITFTQGPINRSCANDAARIINSEEGLVVFYGFQRQSQDIKNIEEALNIKKLVYCPTYILTGSLRCLTKFDSRFTFLNLTEYEDLLYNAVTSADYDDAVKMCLELRDGYHAAVVSKVVTRLLYGVHANTMTFAYQLWLGGGKDIVAEHFPPEVDSIFNSYNVKLINNKYLDAMKLAPETDQYRDRLALGVSKDETEKKLSWKFIPETVNNHVVFKINNNEYSMFLKLDVNEDSVGDRLCWGSKESNEKRHKWTLEPLIFEGGEILFFIVNCKYEQALKMGIYQNADKIRGVYGHGGKYMDDPGYFGWKIDHM